MSRSLQLLLLATLAVLSAAQHQEETPEVVQAKAEHFRAHRAALQATGGRQNHHSYHAHPQPHHQPHHPHPQEYQHRPYFHGQAQPQPQYQPKHFGVPNGDTPEVEQAKAEHFRLYNEAAAKAAPPRPNDDGQYRPSAYEGDNSGGHGNYQLPVPVAHAHTASGNDFPAYPANGGGHGQGNVYSYNYHSG